MLDTKELRCFLTVADELSFSRAAERLHLAQPALTRIVKRLEDRMGGKLFDRDTRNVALTELGEALVSDVRSAMKNLDTIEAKARRLVDGEEDIVRIGYMNFVTHDILGPVLTAFQSDSPKTKIELNYLGTLEQRKALREEWLDIAFMIGPYAAPGVATRTMRLEEMMIVMRKDHPLAARESIAPSDLTEVPMVLGNEELWSVYRSYLFPIFERQDVVPRIVQEVPTPAAIFSLVSAGVGITIYPRAAKFYYHTGLELRPFVIDGPRMATICAWNRHNPKPAVTSFLAQVSEFEIA